ncbi:MAG: hypothetical protein ACRD1Y_02785 [Terriglobales bacterium]
MRTAIATAASGCSAASASELLREFFLHHAQVELSEAGQRLARVGDEHTGYALHPEPGRLVCHFWAPEANLVRRIVGVRRAGRERLELDVLRLGQTRPSRLVLRAAGAHGEMDRGRDACRQALWAAVQRDWTEWRLINAAGPKGHGAVVRFLLQRQQRLLVCAAVDSGEGAADVLLALAQALVWAGQLRAQYRERAVAEVRLIVPPGGEVWLRLLHGALRAPPALSCYHLDRTGGRLEPVALSDAGNTASGLRRAAGAAGVEFRGAEAAALLSRVRRSCPQATWETAAEGYGYVSVYGLPVVRESTGTDAQLATGAGPRAAPFVFGCGGEQTPLVPETEDLFQRWLDAVGRERATGGSRAMALYAAYPEAWMGHMLRHDPQAFDAQLQPGALHAEVPIATPAGKAMVDLLALNRAGRLVVTELKAAEDLTFPLQALLYWQQVKQHQTQGDLERLGYFPGRAISPEAPLLWLVAPALRWHPLTPWLTPWLAEEVPCTLIGLNEEWRRAVQVVFRKPA